MDLGNMTIAKADKIAKQYYSNRGYNHAKRVADCLNINMIPKGLFNSCYIVALLHDLFEDTNITIDKVADWSDDLFYTVIKLTHDKKNVSYESYCKDLSRNKDRKDSDLCAWFVKLADMKDHLTQTGTLTDELKEKYLKGMAELL